MYICFLIKKRGLHRLQRNYKKCLGRWCMSKKHLQEWEDLTNPKTKLGNQPLHYHQWICEYLKIISGLIYAIFFPFEMGNATRHSDVWPSSVLLPCYHINLFCKLNRHATFHSWCNWLLLPHYIIFFGNYKTLLNINSYLACAFSVWEW